MATREIWEARVREWKKSGLTAAEYAAQKDLTVTSLYWWSSKAARQSARRAPPVVEVVVAERSSRPLEVQMPSGLKVCVPVDFDEETLARLLTVLEAR